VAVRMPLRGNTGIPLLSVRLQMVTSTRQPTEILTVIRETDGVGIRITLRNPTATIQLPRRVTDRNQNRRAHQPLVGEAAADGNPEPIAPVEQPAWVAVAAGIAAAAEEDSADEFRKPS